MLEVVVVWVAAWRRGALAAALLLAWSSASCGPPIVTKKHGDGESGGGDAGPRARDAGKPEDAPSRDADGEGGRGGSMGGAAGRGGAGGAKASAGKGGAPATTAAGSGGSGGASAGAGGSETSPWTWSAPALIEAGTADAHLVTLARNRRGDVVVSWWQDDPAGYIWMRRFMNGAWDMSTFRASGTSPGTFNWDQFTAIDRDASVQLFWLGGTTDSKTPSHTYWVRWEGEASVPNDTPPLVLGDQAVGFPIALSIDESGFGTAAWVSEPSSADEPQTMYVNTRDAGGWGTPVAIRTVQPPLNDARLFWTATDGNGGFATAVVYNDQDASKAFRSVHTYIDHAGTVAVPDPIEVPEAVSSVDLELDATGNAMALLDAGPDSTTRHLYWTRYSASSKTWSTAALITQALTNYEDLTLSGSMQPFAVWLESTSITEASSIGRLVASRYDLGTGRWSEPELITADITCVGGSIWSSADSAGSIAVAWAQSVASQTTAIYYARFTPADGWSKPAVVAPYTGVANVLGLTLSEDGHALLVWRQADQGSSVHDLKWSLAR